MTYFPLGGDYILIYGPESPDSIEAYFLENLGTLIGWLAFFERWYPSWQNLDPFHKCLFWFGIEITEYLYKSRDLVSVETVRIIIHYESGVNYNFVADISKRNYLLF